MTLRLALFDLDDTLYPEISYVYSGFAAVAEMIARDSKSRDSLVQRMKELFEVNRKGVFDRLIEDEGAQQFICPSFLPSSNAGEISRLVKSMVVCYRQHVPSIHLYPDVEETLLQCAAHGIEVGIVTDGDRDVQQSKVAVLGLKRFAKHVIYTDALAPGRAHWKPSPYAFEIALRLFDVAPHEACYIGDNPAKDFVGPARLGIWTIQVVRSDGLYTELEPAQPPDFVISSLRDLFSLSVFNRLTENGGALLES